MAKLLQFRCPKCQRLLFKVGQGASILAYRDKDMRFYQGKNNKMIVECSKCFTISEVTRDGLVEFKKPVEAAA
ncbi:MAG TPA: hypothetical protein DCL42_10360 [Deltaproteobacteria bacterium]|nr:hypothetical protein [Deltaproteobacteria bacterium]